MTVSVYQHQYSLFENICKPPSWQGLKNLLLLFFPWHLHFTEIEIS